MLMVRSPVLMAGLVGLLLSLGLPYLVVGMTIKRRVAAFTSRFPDAIDLLVRGLRSGLPVTETFQVVSHELPGPVGEEFKGVIERIRIGNTMEAALQASAEMLGTADFQFFRSEERRVGKECVRTCSSRCAPYHKKKKK